MSIEDKLYNILTPEGTIESPKLGIYAGNLTWKIFGTLDCKSGKSKMKYENRVFFHTLEDAVLSGYRPCNVCKPMNKEDFEQIQEFVPYQTLEEFYNLPKGRSLKKYLKEIGYMKSIEFETDLE